MLPTNYTYGNWLRSGELDIVESRGNANFTCDGAPSGRQVAGTAVHWGPNPEKNQYASLDWKKYVKSFNSECHSNQTSQLMNIICWIIRVNEHRDFSSDFHVYRVEWLPSGFKFFIDCTKIGEINPPAGGFFELGKFTGDNIWPSTSKMAPFDQPVVFVSSQSLRNITHWLMNSFTSFWMWPLVALSSLTDARTSRSTNLGLLLTVIRWESFGRRGTSGSPPGICIRMTVPCKSITFVSTSLNSYKIIRPKIAIHWMYFRTINSSSPIKQIQNYTLDWIANISNVKFYISAAVIAKHI